jgi:hypothetical protein
VIRDWAAYWILWGLVIFEFWIGESWRARCLDCERSRLRSEPQRQSSQQKAECPASGETVTLIGVHSYDLRTQRALDECSCSGLFGDALAKNSRNNPVYPYDSAVEVFLDVSFPSGNQTTARPQEEYRAQTLIAGEACKNHTERHPNTK